MKNFKINPHDCYVLYGTIIILFSVRKNKAMKIDEISVEFANDPYKVFEQYGKKIISKKEIEVIHKILLKTQHNCIYIKDYYSCLRVIRNECQDDFEFIGKV